MMTAQSRELRQIEEPWSGWVSPTDRGEGGGADPFRILVPYNGSATARKALDIAARLSAGRSSLVWVLYVRHWDVGRAGCRTSLETVDEARQCAQAAVTDLRQRGVATSAVVRDARREKVAQAIVAEAEALGAGCVVLGTHARRAWGSALLGSTSHAVARLATRPVIMVKAPKIRSRWRLPWRSQRSRGHEQP
jgi:nucleotide-binding universal stress UspA family protein